MEYFLIIAVMLIFLFQYHKNYRDIKRENMLANYKFAEFMGICRLKYSDATGILFQTDIYKCDNENYIDNIDCSWMNY